MNSKFGNGDSLCAPERRVHVCRQRLVLLLLFASGGGCTSGRAMDFGPWEHRMQITFAGYTQPETLSQIPLLVELGTNRSGFSYGQFASAGGADLRFSDAGMNELPYEIDWWDVASNSYVWVLVPSLSGASTAIVAWWGNPAATVPPAYTTNGAVWSNRYAGVYHMTQTNAQDSSAHAAHGTAGGSPTSRIDSVDGGGFSIGRSVEFGTNVADSIVVPNHGAIDGQSAMTFSARYHRLGLGENQQARLLSKLAAVGPPDQFVYRLYHRADKLYHYDFDLAGAIGDSAAESSRDLWEHVELIYDGATSNACLYVNGVLQSQTSGVLGSTGSSSSGDPDLYIGNDYSATNALAGILDEVRISNTARSSNWVWATWMNMASGSVFNAYSPVVNKFRGTLFHFR